MSELKFCTFCGAELNTEERRLAQCNTCQLSLPLYLAPIVCVLIPIWINQGTTAYPEPVYTDEIGYVRRRKPRFTKRGVVPPEPVTVPVGSYGVLGFLTETATNSVLPLGTLLPKEDARQGGVRICKEAGLIIDPSALLLERTLLNPAGVFCLVLQTAPLTILGRRVELDSESPDTTDMLTERNLSIFTHFMQIPPWATDMERRLIVRALRVSDPHVSRSAGRTAYPYDYLRLV